MEMTRLEAFEKILERDYTAAAERLNTLTVAEPENACGWYCYSQALEQAGETTAAINARRQAIALDPLLAHDKLFEGDRRWFNRDYQGALESYEEYLEMFPVGPFTSWALRRTGGCLIRMGQGAEAIRIYRKVLELEENHADSLLDLGLLLRESGKMEESLYYLGRARAALPDRSDYAFALGTTLVMAGRLEEGTKELVDAARRKPTSVPIRRNLALVLMEQNRLGDAAGQIRVALSLAPSDPAIRKIARRLQQSGVIF
jgi:tetratricopeptide (TPR) repeat protein